MKNWAIKFMLLVVLVLCFATLTGCVYDEVKLEIRPDGSGSLWQARYYTEETLTNTNYNYKAMKESGEFVTRIIDGVEHIGQEYLDEFSNIEQLFNEIEPSTFVGAEIIKESDGQGYLVIDILIQSNANLFKMYGINPDNPSAPDTSMWSLDVTLNLPDNPTKITGLESDEYILDKNVMHISAESDITETRSAAIYCPISLAEFGIEKHFEENEATPSQEGLYECLITPVTSYNNQFKDLNTSSWFYDSAVRVYNTGLIKGISDDTFAPNELLTMEQIITLAARVRSRYDNDGETFEKKNASDPWYQPYIDYAEEKGIIGENTVQDRIGKAALRNEMAYVVANILPESAYESLNKNIEFADVSRGTAYYKEIYKLVDAGLILGTGENKYDEPVFNPDSLLNRAQAVLGSVKHYAQISLQTLRE